MNSQGKILGVAAAALSTVLFAGQAPAAVLDFETANDKDFATEGDGTDSGLFPGVVTFMKLNNNADRLMVVDTTLGSDLVGNLGPGNAGPDPDLVTAHADLEGLGAAAGAGNTVDRGNVLIISLGGTVNDQANHASGRGQYKATFSSLVNIQSFGLLDFDDDEVVITTEKSGTGVQSANAGDNSFQRVDVGGNSEFQGVTMVTFDFNGSGAIADIEYSVVPIPAALPLFATALAGLGVFGWRRKRSTA